jgi:uncharacterized protein
MPGTRTIHDMIRPAVQPPTRTISNEVARRFLVIRHLLAPPRSLPAEPASVMRVVERLGSVQFDPLEVAGRNHDLVLLARIAGYEREWTDALLYKDRLLFEAYNKGLSLLPTSELPWYRLTWDRALRNHEGGAFDTHAPLVEELLGRIRRDGPLSSTDVQPRAAIEWYWRPTNQVRALLEALAEAGILGLARREGNRRVYDLAERLFPKDVLADRQPERDQRRHRLLSRYRAHGLLGRTGSAEIFMGTTPPVRERATGTPPPMRGELLAELIETGRLVAVHVDGVRGERFVLAEEVALLDRAAAELDAGEPPGGAAPGVAFLAPLDPLMWDRQVLRPLFGFDYIWEVYVPEKKRRWGYYVLPVQYGDRLVGRVEPRFERRTGTLRILGLWWEERFDPLADDAFVGAFAEAVEAHCRFGGVRRVAFPRAVRHRAFVAALRSRLGVSPGA